MSEIKQWLEGDGSYEDGLAIFVKLSKNRHIVNYLMRKRDEAKLRYEIEKLCSFKPEISITHKIIAKKESCELEKPKERLKIVNSGTVRFEDLPEALKEVYLRLCELYRTMRPLHEKLKLLTSDGERAEVRQRLVSLENERIELWDIFDDWAKDGTLPTSKQDIDKDIPTDAQAVNSARASITRNLGLLAKESDSERVAILVERLRKPVLIIQTSGGEFKGNAELLRKHGLIE